MDKTTRAILLHRIDHSESSAILKVLTPEEGFISLIWKGAKKKKKGGNYGSIAIPLNRLELQARFKEAGGLHTLKEAKVERPFQNLMDQPERSSIALFLSEFLYRITPHHPPDADLYEELEAFIEVLDRSEDPRDLHVHLIARSMQHHGIAPHQGPAPDEHFDLWEGLSKKERPEHPHFLDPEQSSTFYRMLSKGPHEYQRFLKGRKARKDLLAKLIEHYRLHLGEFGRIRSLEVLEALYDDEPS